MKNKLFFAFDLTDKFFPKDVVIIRTALTSEQAIEKLWLADDTDNLELYLNSEQQALLDILNSQQALSLVVPPALPEINLSERDQFLIANFNGSEFDFSIYTIFRFN